MPRHNKKNKDPEHYCAVRHIAEDSDVSRFAPMSLPLIRKSSPLLMAYNIKSVTPTRYEDLSTEDKVKWDAREKATKLRKENTITIEYELGAYGTHELRGNITNADGNDTYIEWQWLRNRISMDEVRKYMVPEGKYSYQHHTISETNTKFKTFLDSYQDGDEIWMYENTGFMLMAGRAGWLILRDNKIINSHQTCMN